MNDKELSRHDYLALKELVTKYDSETLIMAIRLIERMSDKNES